MRLNCKNKVIEVIKQIEKQPANRNCRGAMLIVDETTGNLLSSVVKEFFALGVLNITKIQLKKQPRPQSMGIYYISSQSLPLLAEDFAEEPIFHSINLLMPEEITTDIMKQVGGEKKIMERLAFFAEFKLNVRYASNKCGLICEQHRIFQKIVNNELKNMSENIAQKLMEAIVCGYGDNFVIKVYYTNFAPHHDIIKTLTKSYQQHRSYLESTQSNLTEEQLTQQNNSCKTIHLLLVERTIDLISPLVRNYYYLTMVSDLFQVDFAKKDIALREGKTITLNYEDPIFQKYKNLHISKAQSRVQPDFKEFQSQNEAAKLMKNQKNLQNMELKHIIRDIPEYNRKVNSFQEQISIMGDIKQLSKEQNLPELGEIEQMIVSGINGHGEELKDARILEKTMKFAETLKIHNYDNYIKILVLLLMCVEMDKTTKTDVIKQINAQQRYPSLSNFLKHMKIIESGYKPRKLKPTFKKEKSFLDLHESTVSTILCELIERGNSKSVNLAVIGQNKKHLSKFENISNKENKEWLVCMLGGMALNEMCQLERLEEVYKNNTVNFVTTEILTTWNCLQTWSDVFTQELEL